MISREYCGERVLLVCHSVVVLCMRYLLEHMTEEQILAIDRADEIANCSVTSYRYDATAAPTRNFEARAVQLRRAAGRSWRSGYIEPGCESSGEVISRRRQRRIRQS